MSEVLARRVARYDNRSRGIVAASGRNNFSNSANDRTGVVFVNGGLCQEIR